MEGLSKVLSPNVDDSKLEKESSEHMFLRFANSRYVCLAIGKAASRWQGSLEDNELLLVFIADTAPVERVMSFLPFQQARTRGYFVSCEGRFVVFGLDQRFAIFDTSAVEGKYKLVHSLRWDGLAFDKGDTHSISKYKGYEESEESEELDHSVQALLKYVKKLASTNINDGAIKLDLEGLPYDVRNTISEEADVRTRVFDGSCAVSH